MSIKSQSTHNDIGRIYIFIRDLVSEILSSLSREILKISNEEKCETQGQ